MQPFRPDSEEAWQRELDWARIVLSALYKRIDRTRLVYNIAREFGYDETAVSHHIDFLLHGVRDGAHADQGNRYFSDRNISPTYYTIVQDYARAMRIT